MKIQIKIQKARIRSAKAETLVSLLVAMVITSFVISGIMGLVYMNTATSMRATNKCDSVNQARVALENIGKALRTARCVGEAWENVETNNQALFPTQPPPGLSTTTEVNFASFPAASGTNNMSTGWPAASDPFYGTTPKNGVDPNPIGGWPTGAGWANDAAATGTQRWVCGPACLIVQVPVFGSTGIPLGYAAPPSNIPLMDTLVYRVFPDTAPDAMPNTFRLEMASFPCHGAAIDGFRPAGWTTSPAASSVPKVMLRGITGPRDAGGVNPRIFQYLSSTNPATPIFFPTTNDNPPGSSILNISGVSVNLETVTSNATSQRTRSAMQFKTDLYMRNNVSFTN